MRLGVMIGAERGDMARKVSKLVSDIQWAESAGLDSAWMPQVPNDFDLLTMVALMAANTLAHRTRHRGGAAAGAAPDRAGPPGAVRARDVRMAGLALGVGPSHHWIVRDMLGLPYEKPAAYTRDYLQVLNTAIAGSGDLLTWRMIRSTVHNPTVLGRRHPDAGAGVRAGPGDAARSPVSTPTARRCGWPTRRRSASTSHPKINKAAAEAGKPAPRIVAGIPVTLCANSEIEAAKERANRILAEAETSPNYQRLLDRGEARSVGDLCAAGDEESILKRFKQFADAGVTDLSVRLLPIGDNRDELIASKYRTREVIAELAKQVCDERLVRRAVVSADVNAPLAGIRIIEVGVMLAGPYATMMLADLGAEVIKVEPPGGEISRQVSDSYFASLNRGKRSICLDLASERRVGRNSVELVADSHALLVNMKPSVIRRLGLTYENLRRFNEKIVCVAMTGFGLDGGDDPAFDYVIQAATGVAAMTGDPDGPPTLPGYSSADNSTGLTAALGLLAMIVSGDGGQVDVSLRDVMLSQLNYRASAYLERRCRAAPPPVRGAFVLRPGATVPDRRRLSGVVHHPRRVLEVVRR